MMLFTTLAGDKRPLYTRDLLRSCCAPIGQSIVFGYGRKWFPANISAGQKVGVIVFGEVRRADDPERQRSYLKYHPVRKLIVTDVHERPAGGKTFTLKLGHFFDYSDPNHEANRQLLQSWYERQTDAPHSANGRLFVHSATDLWPDQEFFTETGPEPLIGHMSTVYGLGARHFFFIDRKDKWVDKDAFRDHRLSNGAGRFTWRAGKTYGLSIVVYPGKSAEFTPPEVTVGDGLCSISGPFTEQLEEGFRARFLLTCRRTFDRQAGMLWIRVPSSDPKLLMVSPELQEHIELLPPTGVVLLIIVLLALGSILPPLIPTLVKKYGWPEPVGDVAPVVASLFIPLAGYLLLRRIKV
jgi:hypothetical protein